MFQHHRPDIHQTLVFLAHFAGRTGGTDGMANTCLKAFASPRRRQRWQERGLPSSRISNTSVALRPTDLTFHEGSAEDPMPTTAAAALSDLVGTYTLPCSYKHLMQQPPGERTVAATVLPLSPSRWLTICLFSAPFKARISTNDSTASDDLFAEGVWSEGHSWNRR